MEIIDSPRTKVRQLEQEATLLRNQGHGNKAVEVYKLAKDLYQILGEDAHAAGCQHMIGVSYKIENNAELALPAYELAVEEYQRAGDKLGPGRVWRDVGIMYDDRDQLDKAEEYIIRSFYELTAINQETDTQQQVGEAAARDAELGITLAKLGMVHTRQGKMQEAAIHLHEGLRLTRAAGHAFYEMTAALHIAGFEMANHNDQSALTYLHSALWIVESNNMHEEHPRRLAQIWGLMAHCDPNEASAASWAKNALEYIETLSDSAQSLLLKDIRADELRARFNLSF